MKLWSLLLAATAAPVMLSACHSRANSFNQCVLSHVGPSKPPVLARELCANQFQEQLPDSAVSKLTGNASEAGYEISATIVNQNPDWTITRVQITANPHSSAPQITRRANVFIEPMQQDTAHIPNPPSGMTGRFDWNIDKAWGIPRTN